MKKIYCTYFDKNYLLKGVALIQSLAENEENDFIIFVVCLDEITRIILKGIGLSHVQLIPLHDIEKNDNALIKARGNRELVEYYWTLTPSIILWAMQRCRDSDIIIYVDADLHFYSSPKKIFEEFKDASILIHEHRFSPSLQHLARHGHYNVGLLAFKKDKFALEALQWWRERCLEWCYARIEDGKFGDQLYLEDWPKRFKNVHVLQNIGSGVAPWNHDKYTYTFDYEKNTLVDREYLIFYHFHSFTFINPAIIVPAKNIEYKLSKDIIRYCFIPYIDRLEKTIKLISSRFNEFKFGMYNNDLHTGHTFLAKKNISSILLKEKKLAKKMVAIDENWDCFISDQFLTNSIIATPDTQTFKNKKTQLAPNALNKKTAQNEHEFKHRSSANKEKKSISVIISTYKSEDFMEECLQELIKQTIFNELEIIVIDANSPQKEEHIVKSYQKYYKNINYLKLNKRIGIYPAWNIGIKKTTAPYITPFSTNDRLNPAAYETLKNALDEHGDIDLVYGDTYTSPTPHTPFEMGRDIPSLTQKWPDYSYFYLLTNNCIGPHPMWRRSVHTTVGCFSEEYAALGDQEFWLRLGRHSKMLHLPFFSGMFWTTQNSLSGGNTSEEFTNIREKYMREYVADHNKITKELNDLERLVQIGHKTKVENLIKNYKKKYFYIFEDK